jgi:hypothetical protein
MRKNQVVPNEEKRTISQQYQSRTMSLLEQLANRIKEQLSVKFAQWENFRCPFPPVSFVTAADAKYFVPLKRLLRTIIRHEQGRAARIIVFDMGFKSDQLATIATQFPTVQVETFDVNAEIPWASISKNAGFYAWKPMMIHRVMHRFGHDVIWLDSSVVVRRPLWRIRQIMRSRGFYASYWSGWTIAGATAPQTISRMNAEAEADLPMIVATAVGFSVSNQAAVKMLSEWEQQTKDPAINNPPDATTGTHKGDQSVLSVLAYRSGIVERLPERPDSWRLDYFIENNRKTMFLEPESQ